MANIDRFRKGQQAGEQTSADGWPMVLETGA